MRKLILYIFIFVASLIISFYIGLNFALSYISTVGSKLEEPRPIGILLNEITNNSNTEATLINVFTYDYYKIKPKETITIHSWLPNMNYIKKALGFIISRGTISNPADRFLLLQTKIGLMKITFGRSYSFLTGYSTKLGLWVTEEKGTHSQLQEINNYNIAKKLMINVDGKPEIDNEPLIATENIYSGISNYERYKNRLSNTLKENESNLLFNNHLKTDK